MNLTFINANMANKVIVSTMKLRYEGLSVLDMFKNHVIVTRKCLIGVVLWEESQQCRGVDQVAGVAGNCLFFYVFQQQYIDRCHWDTTYIVICVHSSR